MIELNSSYVYVGISLATLRLEHGILLLGLVLVVRLCVKGVVGEGLSLIEIIIQLNDISNPLELCEEALASTGPLL